jgi:hypothetical protein
MSRLLIWCCGAVIYLPPVVGKFSGPAPVWFPGYWISDVRPAIVFRAGIISDLLRKAKVLSDVKINRQILIIVQKFMLKCSQTC